MFQVESNIPSTAGEQYVVIDFSGGFFGAIRCKHMRNDALDEGSIISDHIVGYGAAESDDSEIVKPIPDRQVYYSSDCIQIWYAGTL